MALADRAKKKETAKDTGKSKNVMVPVPEHLQETHDRWLTSIREYKDAKAEMEQAEQEIVEHVEPRWRKACQDGGRVQNSVAFGNIRLTFKSKSQFLTSTSTDADRLKDVFGEEEYNKYFKEVPGPLQLNQELLADKDVEQEVEAALDGLLDKYPDLLVQNTKVQPTDGLFSDFVLDEQKHDEIELKLKKAGAKRTKTTFAAR
jgi:hypothetical protein